MVITCYESILSFAAMTLCVNFFIFVETHIGTLATERLSEDQQYSVASHPQVLTAYRLKLREVHHLLPQVLAQPVVSE